MSTTPMTRRLPTRSDIPAEHRWNAESVFPTPAAWDEAVARLEDELVVVETFRGTLADGPERVREWLEHRQTLATHLGKLVVYASLAYSVDTTDPGALERYDRARSLRAKAGAATAFAEPELLAIGLPKLFAWAEESERLAVYKHYFERLENRAQHLRSAEVEQLLGELDDPFGTATSAHGVLANGDLRFEPAVDSDGNTHDIGQGNIRSLLGSPDRTLRESAYNNYADAHLALQNTMATVLSAGIKQNVWVAKTRRYPSALEASLLPERIPKVVFTQLLDTFRDKLPVWHRYWRVRRQLVGVDGLEPHDLFAPLTQDPPTVRYEQSVDWLCDALAPLGDDYIDTLRRGALDERWVDRYPNRGKRMGAFSSGVRGTHPFIMMSYSDDVFGMSTLAHELGHSMHSYYSFQDQPQLYSRYSLFVAEVASNFNQAMLRAHLLNTLPDQTMQLAVLEEAMANFYRYLFIMPTLARFELDIHERTARGEPLGAPALNTLMADLLEEGYGDELSFDRDRVGITWAQFHTHLYSRFYVYQYATGISGANALANRILRGEEGAADDYRAFLSAGGSRYPLDALKLAGVDLSTSEPIEEAFGVLEGLVERLETFV